jgi:hypothetical protein
MTKSTATTFIAKRTANNKEKTAIFVAPCIFLIPD